MKCVSAETPLALSREEVWRKLQDLRLAKFYVPGVTDLEITTAATGGVGASRRIFSRGRPPLDETVVSWREGEGFTIRLHNGKEAPSPFAEAQFTYRLCDAEADACCLQIELRYRLPHGWWHRCLDWLVMRHYVGHMVNSIAKGLRHFYETGTSANPLVPN